MWEYYCLVEVLIVFVDGICIGFRRGWGLGNCKVFVWGEVLVSDLNWVDEVNYILDFWWLMFVSYLSSLFVSIVMIYCLFDYI